MLPLTMVLVQLIVFGRLVLSWLSMVNAGMSPFVTIVYRNLIFFFFAQKDYNHIDQDSNRKAQETKEITDRSS